MRAPSLEELRGQVAAGTYAIDSGDVAGTILSNFALVRRVGRELRREERAGELPGRSRDRRGAGESPANRSERRTPGPS
jgi:hypothetical protein